MIWDVGRHTFRYDWNQSSSDQSCSSCLHLHYVGSPTHRSAIPIPIQEDCHSNKDTNSTTIAHRMSQEQHPAQLMNLLLTRTVLLSCDLPAWTASSLLRLSSACHTWSSRFHLNCFKLGGLFCLRFNMFVCCEIGNISFFIVVLPLPSTLQNKHWNKHQNSLDSNQPGF